ncbi:DNA polymerase III subunit gamma/tau [Caldimonas tepidiphila]|uniref:DNA polymerase III subunit gamma/tau n=1 Tax=Caldimonas tepidiphila TaxID=2315841 RepID=UPI000E5B39D5|nr:DNA polymerase III subunit gamma/tau [Caldimonas tepidiphila]
MSYLVLARKYRPRSFEQMVGQEHVVQALSNALTAQRLHHAYLFTGTRGVGKTTVSRILAKSLNCQGPDGQGGITAHPCGVCQPCCDIDSGRFPDYVELDAASNRGVEEISQLLDQAVYKPVVGRFKVYMIDEVHMLSNTAFNAMLKTLEEPPEYLKFVLATTDPQKVPVTVLSRCLQFNLRPMAPETVLEHLREVLAAEDVEAEPGALRLLSRAARGSMRDALSLTDQAIAFGSGRLGEAGVRQMLGAVDRSHVFRLIGSLAEGDGAAVVATVEELRAQGLSAHGALEEMAGTLQQMAVLQAVPQAADAADPDAETVARLAAALAPDETQLLYSIALHGRQELGLAPDEYGGMVMVLLRMLAFRPPGGRVMQPAAVPPARTGDTRASAPAAAPATATAPPSGPRPAMAERVAPPAAAVPTPAARSPAAMPSPGAPVPPRAAPAGRSVEAPARSAAPAGGEPPPWEDVPIDESELAQFEAPRRTAPAPAGAARPARPAAAEPRAAPEPTRPAVAVPPPPAAPASAPAPSPVTAPAGGAAAPDAGAGALGDRWHALVQQMIERERIVALVRELAMQSQCVGLDEGSDGWLCRLQVERETLAGDANRNKLQAALAEVLERPGQLQIAIASVADSPARREAAARAERQREAEEIIRNDPLVVELMQQFRTARIVPGSIRPL